MKSKVKIVLVVVISAIFLFFLVSLLVPPLFQTHAVQKKDNPNPEKNSFERVRCVDDNVEALQWRLRVIEEAKEELIFTTFSYQDDEAGKDLMAALLHAADRGVRVRAVVDGFSGFTSMQHSKLFQALADAPNLEIRFYNPVNLLTPWKINYRMHDKYIVADDQVYILGGRNTKNLSLGNYQEKKDVDRDVVVYNARPDANSSLEQVRTYFESIWALPSTRPFGKGKTPDEGALQELRAHYDHLREAYPEAFTQTDWEAETMEAQSVTLLHNPIQPSNKEPTLWLTLMDLMDGGEDLLIQTPYMICNRQMYEDLYHLDARGGTIKVLTNAVESGANIFGCADYLNEKKHIQSIGAETYEFMGGDSRHTKTVLVGDHLSLVGSFNCDMRSAYIDTELMLAIESPEFNAHLRQMAETSMNQSRRVTADGTETLMPDCAELHLSFGKKLALGLMRILILPARHIL